MSRPLLISFGSYACKPEFVSATDDCKVDRLFLLDTTKQWYQGGVDGYGSIEETVAKLRSTIDHLGPSSVVTIGTSMGGYAALLFGHLLKANSAIAFCPQTFLSRQLRSEFEDNRWEQEFLTIQDGRYSDLVDVLTGSDLQSFVLYSQDSAIDDLHALRLCYTPLSKITILGYEKMGHNTPLLLRDRGVLTPFIESVANGHPDLAQAGPDLLIVVDEEKSPARFALLSEKRRRGQTMEGLEDALSLRQQWAYGFLLLARERRLQGNYAGALCVLAKAIAIRPSFAEAYVDQGICYREIGAREEATTAFAAACKYDGKRSSSHVLLAECLIHCNRLDDAVVHLEHAIRLTPGWRKPLDLLGSIRKP